MPTNSIEIVVNGVPQEVPAGTTILALLHELHVNPQRVAVELDRVIIKAAAWPDATLSSGSKIEIVHFVGGG